jgi:hypothetical protein
MRSRASGSPADATVSGRRVRGRKPESTRAGVPSGRALSSRARVVTRSDAEIEADLRERAVRSRCRRDSPSMVAASPCRGAALVASTSTRCRNASWSVCTRVWCGSRRWTRPRSPLWLSTCLPRKSPARPDNGLLACKRFVERLSSRISSARPWHVGSATSTHLSLTTPLAIPHECRACAATSCFSSRRSIAGEHA